MDSKIEFSTEIGVEPALAPARAVELNELQLLLAGGGCGDVVFA